MINVSWSIQTHFALTSAASWDKIVGMFNYDEFYWNLLEFLEGPDGEDIIKLFNQYVTTAFHVFTILIISVMFLVYRLCQKLSIPTRKNLTSTSLDFRGQPNVLASWQQPVLPLRHPLSRRLPRMPSQQQQPVQMLRLTARQP